MTNKILPHITKQQHHILKLIYTYRFLNRIQIQAFLNHKNRKTINTWLPDLVQKDYLKRIYSTHFTEKSKPAIYYMSTNGIRLMKEIDEAPLEELRKRYREDIRTDTFIGQQILLADMALSFLEKDSETTGIYSIFTQTDFVSKDAPYGFLTDLSPNMVLISKKKESVISYLLELFSPTTPKYSIKKRTRDYIKFFESGDWEENSDIPFPIILLVCPTKPTLIYAKRYVKKLKEEEQFPDELMVWFATETQVREQGVKSEIWEEV